MTIPGKYNDECTVIRLSTGAKSAVVIVFGGNRGSGISVQCDDRIAPTLPDLLRGMADGLEKDMRNMPPGG